MNFFPSAHAASAHHSAAATQPHMSTTDGLACTTKGAIQACGKNLGGAMAGGAAGGAMTGAIPGGVGAVPGAVVGATTAGVGSCVGNMTTHLGGCW